MLFRHHIFICTNQRVEGARVSCGEARGMELVAAFKESVKRRNLQVDVRAQRAGCFDICESGPNVIVYPEGVVYGNVTLNDVEEIMEQHICGDQPVARLRVQPRRL